MKGSNGISTFSVGSKYKSSTNTVGDGVTVGRGVLLGVGVGFSVVCGVDVGPSVCEGVGVRFSVGNGVGLLKGVELNVGLGISVVSIIFFFQTQHLRCPHFPL